MMDYFTWAFYYAEEVQRYDVGEICGAVWHVSNVSVTIMKKVRHVFLYE